MSTQDLTTYTEVDPNSHITVTSARATVANLGRDESAYLYKDFGVDHFGDFTGLNAHKVDIVLAGATASGYAVLWGLSNSVNNRYNWTAGISAGIYFDGVNYQIFLSEVGGAATTYVISGGTTYYLSIERNGTTLTCKIYSDSARTNLLATLTRTVATTAYRYHYAAASLNTGDVGCIISGYGENYATEATPKEVGAAPYAASLPFPPQCGVWFDGKYHAVAWMPGNGVSNAVPVVAYADDADLIFGTAHNIPGMVSYSIRGYDFSIFYGFRQSYGTFVANQQSSSAHQIPIFYKQNDSLNASSEPDTTRSDSSYTEYPSTIIDNNDYIWTAGVYVNGGNTYIKVRRATDPYFTSGWGTLTTLKTITGTPGAFPQLVGYQNGDIGCLISVGSGTAASLYYYHWTASTSSWGSEETVDANVGYFYTYRGVVTRNDKLFVMYRDYTTPANLQYRIRTRSTGTWNSEATAASDLTGTATQNYFTTTADVGKTESVYIFYNDGTNIVYRTWNGTSISGKTTFIASPSQNGTLLQSPYFESQKIAVAYQTGTLVKIETLSITPDQETTSGVFVAIDGHPNLGTYAINQQKLSFGEKSFVFYTSRSGQAWARIYNETSEAWEGSLTALTKRYWDVGHNNMTACLDGSGYVYIFFGGLNGYNTTEYVVVKKSTYPIDNASFNMATGWTDISPSVLSGNRGYKYLVVDNSSIPHLIFVDGVQTFGIREYRSGAWSSPINLVTTGNADYQVYVGDVVLGKEPSGQKSIHLFWSYIDLGTTPSVTGGSILQKQVNYMKIVPQGAGAYKAYKADGTEFTLPCSPTNRDEVYTGDYAQVGGGIDLVDATHPIMTFMKRSSTTPYAITGLWSYRWTGSAWSGVELDTDDATFPWLVYPKLVVGNRVFVASQKLFSGVSEIVTYQSTDNGVTYGSAVQMTSSSAFDEYTPLISFRTAYKSNLIWHERLHRNHSQVNFGSLNIVVLGGKALLNGFDSCLLEGALCR